MYLLLQINSVNWMGGVILVVTVLASGSGICELLRSFMPMTLILVYLGKPQSQYLNPMTLILVYLGKPQSQYDVNPCLFN